MAYNTLKSDWSVYKPTAV